MGCKSKKKIMMTTWLILQRNKVLEKNLIWKIKVMWAGTGRTECAGFELCCYVLVLCGQLGQALSGQCLHCRHWAVSVHTAHKLSNQCAEVLKSQCVQALSIQCVQVWKVSACTEQAVCSDTKFGIGTEQAVLMCTRCQQEADKLETWPTNRRPVFKPVLLSWNYLFSASAPLSSITSSLLH